MLNFDVVKLNKINISRLTQLHVKPVVNGIKDMYQCNISIVDHLLVCLHVANTNKTNKCTINVNNFIAIDLLSFYFYFRAAYQAVNVKVLCVFVQEYLLSF